jgi:hypothetical protein
MEVEQGSFRMAVTVATAKDHTLHQRYTMLCSVCVRRWLIVIMEEG